MRSALNTTILSIFLLWLPSCGGGTVLVESTPRPDPGAEVTPPPPPQGSLEVPRPNVDWMPATISSGLGEGLRKALEERKTIAVILPQNNTLPALEDRVYQMIKTSAPDTRVVARGRAVLDKLLQERGEIPYRTTLEAAGTDILGRPYFIPKDHPLQTDWIQRRAALKGAEGILTVRRIQVDDTKLKRMRIGRQGGCSDYEKALQEGIDRGDAFFRPYESNVNDTLATAFSRHLKTALPYWETELAQLARAAVQGDVAHRCLTAYRQLLDYYKPCQTGPCPSAPQMFRSASGVVGMTDHTALIPNVCPAAGMRNYGRELDDLAARSLAEVLSALDGGWTQEVIRFGGLQGLLTGIKDTCAPRHRRIDPEALKASKSEIAAYLSELSNRELSGVWEPTRGMERIPGVGPVKLLARIRTSGYDPSVESAKITDRLRTIDRCDESTELLFQATLIDVKTSEVPFMGIFFEEELLCEGFPPGSP